MPITLSVPCYALTMPGLEALAAQEITESLGVEMKRTGPGLVIFRPPLVDRSLLELRTVEDVFLLAWGTDKLTYRALDLDHIRRWTAHDVNWQELLRLHHTVRPKPKGKPTYHIVTQMRGEHGYRRADAQKALLRGLTGKFPSSWRPVEEDADIEVWLTITGATAICGLRLSDKTMRHRTYKIEHLPASLRPVVAAAMVRLARIGHHDALLDPMCGAGTILAERLAVQPQATVLAGDIEPSAVRAAHANFGRHPSALLCHWDARQLPLRDHSISRLACNPPFGKQLGEATEIGRFYRELINEWDRVLAPGGRAVILVSDEDALNRATKSRHWRRLERFRLRVLGQPAVLTAWGK
jgi:23S rRNA G2445 N2-methylase RlmL